MDNRDLGLWDSKDKVPEGYKRCSKCSHALLLSCFNKDSRTKDGKTYQCKECQKENSKKSYKKTKTKVVRQRRYLENIEENRERSREYYQQNREEILEKQKEYHKKGNGKKVMKKAHKKRNELMKKNKGKPYTKFQIIQRDSEDVPDPETGVMVTIPICQICGEPIWDDNIHIDHIVPIAEGGLDCYDNMRTTHAQCNLTRPRADVLEREGKKDVSK